MFEFYKVKLANGKPSNWVRDVAATLQEFSMNKLGDNFRYKPWLVLSLLVSFMFNSS